MPTGRPASGKGILLPRSFAIAMSFVVPHPRPIPCIGLPIKFRADRYFRFRRRRQNLRKAATHWLAQVKVRLHQEQKPDAPNSRASFVFQGLQRDGP